MIKVLQNPFFILGAILLLLANSSSHPTNSGGYTGAPGDSVCSTCHSNSNPNFTGQISIDGVPASISAGQMYQITVTVTNPGLNQNEAGFQIVALNSTNTNAGNFTNPSAASSVKTSAGKKYFGHAPSVPFMGLSELTWTVTWTAPATGSGDITFYGGSVLANGNGSSSNDKFVTTETVGTLVSAPTPLSVTLSNVENTSCNGVADGTATAVPTGGTPNYTYSWNNGETTQTATELPAGLARVTVTDNAGGTSTASVNITQPTAINLTVQNTQNPTCFNTANGSISVSASGGNGGFFYDWSNGLSGASINGLTPGTYTVTATDINGCEAVKEIELTGSPAIQVVSAFITNVSCFGGSNGIIDLTASGGTGSLDIVWSNGHVGGYNANLTAGNYVATISDNNNCELEVDYNVNQPQQVGGNIVQTTPIACPGGSNGVALATGSGGVGPYTFVWSTGATTASASNLAAGTYTVTITDKNICTTTRQITLNNPAGMSITTAASTNASCLGVANGSATISVTGGTGPYSVMWATGATGLTLNNVTSGSYACTVTDSKQCTAVSSVSIGSNQQATLSLVSTTPPTCNGLNNGSITIEAINAAGYSVSWSNNGAGLVLNQLTGGTYTAQAANGNGCLSNPLEVQLSQPEAIAEDTAFVNNISCAGQVDGSIEVLYAGGTGTLTYAWSNDSIGTKIDSLSAGVYNLTITDDNECVDTAMYSILEPAAISVDSFELSSPTCYNSENGGLVIYVSGGSDTLIYNWTNGLVGDTLNGLASGAYIYEIEDGNGCLLSDTLNLNGPAVFLANDTITNTSIPGASDGQITTSFSGGSAPYSYLWSTGDTLSFIDSLSEGLYFLTLTDSLGCNQVFQFNVQSGDCALSVDFETTPASCFGAADGEVQLNVSNGTAPFTVNNPVSGLVAGTYDYVVTDSLGCNFAIEDVVISQPTALSITVDSIFNASGPTEKDGQITVSVVGGTLQYQYLWLDTNEVVISTSEDLSGALPGQYFLIVTDQNGCALVTDTLVISFISSSDDTEPIEGSVIPNPFMTQLIVKSGNEAAKLDIFTSEGKKMLALPFESQIDIILQTNDWAPGLYLVRLTNLKGKVQTFKVIKQ
ncbi:MAG: T9SS type A sorting domain-containing protein [Saprospiraceae bacterium]|nr:T9SS type A sorting domain-containing protein [Saprospiraceae bacterium]